MPDSFLDLDAVIPQTTEISKQIDGARQTWLLRDDIPTEVLISVLRLMEHAQARRSAPLPADESAAVQALRESLEGYVAETLSVFIGLWHHSYPQESPDDLARWFTHEERERIVQLFFYRRLRASSPPSDGTADTTATTPPSSSPMPPVSPNRAERRSHTGRAAIPSQKRLERELRGL